MNTPIDKFPQSSAVWIYQANRPLETEEQQHVSIQIEDFIESWESHGKLLKASFEIKNALFVILYVDPEGDSMCGRAKDASINKMKQLEQELDVEFLNRDNQSYEMDGNVHVFKFSELDSLIKDGQITSSTVVFNNTVTTIEELNEKWKQPLSEGWLSHVI